MMLETERLYLREMKQADFDALCKILKDKDVMYAYEGAFCDTEIQEWLDRQAVWTYNAALERGGSERMHWHRGYATEAARARCGHAPLSLHC